MAVQASNPARQGALRSARGYQRPPGSLFTLGEKYAGERLGRRVNHWKGDVRTLRLRGIKARAAILSAMAVEDADLVGKVTPTEVAAAFEPTPAQAVAATIQQAAAPKKRAPAKKKAAAE